MLQSKSRLKKCKGCNQVVWEIGNIFLLHERTIEEYDNSREEAVFESDGMQWGFFCKDIRVA